MLEEIKRNRVYKFQFVRIHQTPINETGLSYSIFTLTMALGLECRRIFTQRRVAVVLRLML
jgi:hypothetical protein